MDILCCLLSPVCMHVHGPQQTGGTHGFHEGPSWLLTHLECGCGIWVAYSLYVWNGNEMSNNKYLAANLIRAATRISAVHGDSGIL